jgi:hypothetical protein
MLGVNIPVPPAKIKQVSMPSDPGWEASAIIAAHQSVTNAFYALPKEWKIALHVALGPHSNCECGTSKA